MPPDAPAAKPSAGKASGAKTPAAKSGAAKATKAKRCPVCGKPATEQSRPFCSERCRDVDLNRWLSGAYVISAAPSENDED
ncbi:DNA gyrase inhibitor YacG [Rhodopseudomonas pseudopalustris]|uniref:DNA gyrase inhibitor YacG n=1 Tax=Rhodopseudomonas pseudopalustris TaxID=1513892 RepID=UPI000ACC814D